MNRRDQVVSGIYNLTELPEPKQEKTVRIPQYDPCLSLFSPCASNVLLRIAEVWLDNPGSFHPGIPMSWFFLNHSSLFPTAQTANLVLLKNGTQHNCFFPQQYQRPGTQNSVILKIM